MKAIWITVIVTSFACSQSCANLDTHALDEAASVRAASLEENPIEWSRDSTPVIFDKYRLYISELEKTISKLMEVYYYEEDWISHGPARIEGDAIEFAILDYPGRTVRGASGFEGKILRLQISTLENRIVTIANRVYEENDDKDGYSRWAKLWESRKKWVEPIDADNPGNPPENPKNQLDD